MASLRKLQMYYFGLVSLLMATGVGALVLGNIWLAQARNGSAPREAVISEQIELAGTVIGGVVTFVALVGFYGGSNPVKHKKVLLFFVWLLVGSMLAELALGGVIWFKTLRMRSLFQVMWPGWSDSLRSAFQEMTSYQPFGVCCGYSVDAPQVALGGSCPLKTTPNVFCADKVIFFADSYLRKLFTSLFGFSVVNVFCLISTIILIQARNDEERYIRIGRKESPKYSI